MRPLEYKPLLYTTTMRNPGRLKQLMYVLKKFEGQILTDELATDIVGECIRYGVYRPTKQTQTIKEKWKLTPKGNFSRLLLTKKEVSFLIKNNEQQHKEAGFEKGYPSRFATMYDLCKELGFAYFKIGEPIEISDLGNHLIDALNVQ